MSDSSRYRVLEVIGPAALAGAALLCVYGHGYNDGQAIGKALGNLEGHAEALRTWSTIWEPRRR